MSGIVAALLSVCGWSIQAIVAMLRLGTIGLLHVKHRRFDQFVCQSRRMMTRYSEYFAAAANVNFTL